MTEWISTTEGLEETTPVKEATGKEMGFPEVGPFSPVESVAPQLRAQQVETTLDVQEHQEIRADRDMVRRALLNLMLNALDVMPEGGELVVTSWKGATYFELEVADSGPGIDEASNQKLFEPFFTTKSGGTGLGLAIVDRIVAAHDGDVTVGNCHEGGAALRASGGQGNAHQQEPEGQNGGGNYRQF